MLAPEVTIGDTGDAHILFVFHNQTPATVFQRNNVLWMVFATGEKIDVKPITESLKRKLNGVEIEYQDKAAILRLTLTSPMFVSASALDASWTIALSETLAATPEPAELKAQSSPDGRGVVNGYLSRTTGMTKLHDPVVGDNIMAVQALAPAIGMIKPQQFVDFTSLATAQGAAIVIQGDDLDFRLDDIGFVIGRSSGLPVTVAASQHSLQLSNSPQTVSFGFIDFEGWKLAPVEDYNKIKAELMSRAAMSEGPARIAARLDLARFYVAYEQGEEALGMLKLVSVDDPSAEREISFRVMRGVSDVISGRPRDAVRDLSDPLLDDNPDVAMWRGLAAAQLGDWKLAQRNLEKTQSAIVNYPRDLQAKALLALARATIEMHDLVNTDAILDEAANMVANDAGHAHLALVRGLFNEAVGRYDAAINFYKQIDHTKVSKSSIEALLRMTVLQNKLNQIDDRQAIKTLEDLSYAWRGDDLELQMYQKLGALYVKNDNYRPAFASMRSATYANSDAEISRQLYDDMRVVFTSLYLDGKADKMPPVQALSLFYDYKELTPAGRLGDEIIRNLAGRLVEVDLLDQAIDLLSYQVNSRLNGMARTEVGTELALIHLMNHQPEKTLSVLHRTRLTTMPEDLEKRRTLIEARALAATGRGELATELIGTDTPENMRLRADILWESKNWQLCGQTTEKMLGTPGGAKLLLTNQQRNDILRGAVAFALAGDVDGVQRMRVKFTPAMNDTPDKHMFDVATGPIENQSSEFRTLARNLASVDNLQSFWKTYRESYGLGIKATPQVESTPADQEKKNPA